MSKVIEGHKRSLLCLNIHFRYIYFLKNVSSSTSHNKTPLLVFTFLRLYENLRKVFLTHSFVNRF